MARVLLPALSSWRRQDRDRSAVEGWRYRVAWKPVAEPAAALAGSWLLVAPLVAPPADAAGELVAGCAAALERHGAGVVVLRVGPDTGRGVLAERLRAVADSARQQGMPWAGVVSLLAVQGGDAAGHPGLAAAVASTLTLIQALGDAAMQAPLWVLTRGAVAPTTGEQVPDAVQAQVWGLGRVAALEYPDRWGGLVDLPASWDERAGARMCGVLAGGGGEDQVAVRAGGVFARRLAHAAPRAEAARRWIPAGTVLVTGGTGVLGGHVARWVAHAGAAHVVLASRRGAQAPGARELAGELTAAGARVSVVACDVSDRDAVAGLLAQVRAQDPPLSAVVHTAGAGQGTPLADMDLVEFAAVLDAKVAGARHLDALLGDTPLEAFVLFSSVAGVWGGAGQGAYAAANAALDALAHQRRARGLAATSIAWGLWAEGGMGAGEAGLVMQRRGLQPMAPALAVTALRQAVEHDETALAVAGVDWHRFATTFTSARPSPLIGDLPEVVRALAIADDEESDGQAAQGRWAHRLAGLPSPEQHRLLLDLVCGEAAAVLGHRSPEAVEAGRAFRDLGFDSLTAVELRNRLRVATGLPLPTTLVFDHPTAAVLADRLRADIVPDSGPAAEPVFAELDRLETAVSRFGAVADDATRAGMAARLRAMLSRLDDRGVVKTATAVDSLKSATSEDVFDFVNNELGIF